MIDENTLSDSLGAPTPDTGTMGTTGTRSPKTLRKAESDRVPVSGRVPVVPVVPISRACTSLLDGVFGEGETDVEPSGTAEREPASSGAEQKVALAGGGEEPAASDDDDDCWVIDPDAAAMLDRLEEVDFDDVPVCSCGRYCDVQTLDDVWHCSHCDPATEERRKRTSRMLASVDRILRENDPSD